MMRSMWGVALLGAIGCASSGGRVPLVDPNTREWIQLFNGRDLEDWSIKFAGHALGENYNHTFRVDDGLLKVRYDKWVGWGGEFGHLFYKRRPFSHYVVAVEYRFVGSQVAGVGRGLEWAMRNNGIMIHSQSPEAMGLSQEFPVSLEVQLLGGLGDGRARSTGNLCTPGTHVVMDGALVTRHCTNSRSKTYEGDQWVRVEAVVLGDSLIKHVVNGDTVLTYSGPVLEEGGAALPSGYIALQAETATIDFRKVELLNLAGCRDPEALTYKRYFVVSDSTACFYAAPRR